MHLLDRLKQIFILIIKLRPKPTLRIIKRIRGPIQPYLKLPILSLDIMNISLINRVLKMQLQVLAQLLIWLSDFRDFVREIFVLWVMQLVIVSLHVEGALG